MGKHHLRHDPVCLNCGYTVEKRFCSNCGQENTTPRQSFGHLISHFFEDLTHYEGRFWPTMRYLLLRPGYLTKEYLAGKRAKYVVPVRLYIFISFVSFLLPHLLPDSGLIKESEIDEQRLADSLHHVPAGTMMMVMVEGHFAIQVPNTYHSLQQLDSAQALLPESERMGFLERWGNKKYISLQHQSPLELGDKFLHSFGPNFSKGLFIYMPLFALFIWLFHGKKRWYYFDHAIFTLHYFSFMMLFYSLSLIPFRFISAYSHENVGVTAFLIMIFLLPFSFVTYFFVAHWKFYREHFAVSFGKSLVIMGLNIILFVLLLIVLGYFTILFMH